ncbi:MAG: curved DNA-binding protein CbpA [Verrucomicrobiales bacterium]|jgi:curved DNA-binding protein CbpA
MNPFAVLDLPECAALDSEALRARFQELSRTHHPDKQTKEASSDNSFAEINEAYQKLQTSGRRLKALLELRFPETLELKGSLPEGMLDLFSQIGSALQEADAFIAKKSRATTMLAEALLAPELIKTQRRLGEAGTLIKARLDLAESRLPEIDSLLTSENATLAPISALCREFLYLEKWQGQIQARFHELI